MSTSDEEHVVGAALVEPACLAHIRDIRPEHFFDSRLRTIYAEILRLDAEGVPIDVDLLAARLDGQLEAIGGRQRLRQLEKDTSTAETVRGYADRILDAAKERGVEPPNWIMEQLPPEEPKSTHNGQTAAAKASIEPFEVRRLDEANITPRRAIVQGLGFDEGAVAAIGGSPNAGKTAFAISMVLASASRAETWLGLKIAGGPGVYFGAEAPASVRMRARAGVSRSQLHQAPAFYLSDAVPAIGGELTSAMDAERIIATIETVSSIEGERVLLAVLDTLASCLGDGDENGDGMLRLVASAKHVASRTGACVVLVHHPSKGDGGALRGHGSLQAACDSVVRIETEELTGVRVATLVKSRDHATGLQIRFELEPVMLPERDSFGDPVTTIIVKPSGQAAPRPRPSGQRQRELLGELERRYRTGERSWDEATVCKAGRDLGMHRNSPRDALRGLVKTGYLVGSSMSLSLKYPPEDPK